MQVNINGKEFNVPDGSKISIINDKLFVGGKVYEGPGYENKKFEIEITGGVANIDLKNGNVTVNGNAENIDAGGNVSVKGDAGYVNAGGNANIHGNSGSINAGGNVSVGMKPTGSVKAGGNVKLN